MRSSVSPSRPQNLPKRLKWMRPDEIAATLAADGRLILPVGTCHAYDPTLPLGAATMIVEKLADDLSAEFGVLRAPAIEYGVNPDKPHYPGRVAVRKKTLHRTLNDLLASWEPSGVTEFVILTAHGYDPHLEALTTVATVRARVRTVDLLAVNLSDVAGRPINRDDRPAVIRALLRYAVPDLHLPPPNGIAPSANAGHGAGTNLDALGAELYERVRARISERIFLAPVPTE